MNKNFIRTVGSVTLLIAMLSANVSAVTLYTKDGRSKDFPQEKVEAQLKVGWYKEPFVKMYALDGRSKYVEKSKVEANKKVGWYNGKPVKMYAVDGRTKYVGENEVAANKKVGWYNGKPVKMYAADGRTKYVGQNEVADNEKVGWYSEPVQTLYAPGKSKVFKKSEVEAQKAVGWYEYPVTTVYAEDGRTQVVATSEVKSYKSSGWYTAEQYETVKYAYLAGSDFRSIRNKYSHAQAHGAYLYPYTNKNGDKCIMIYISYKIISNYHACYLHNITKGTRIENPGDYYKRQADNYWGNSKLAYLDLATEALGAQAKAIQGFLGQIDTGYFVNASKLNM